MFKFYGKKIVTWYSANTGRKMVPGTTKFRVTLSSDNMQSAIDEAHRLADQSVCRDQRRDIVLVGTFYQIGEGGRILSECKI